jgi:hypothetical protein
MQHAEIPPPHQHFHIDREAYDISATLDDIYQSGSQPPPSRQNSDRSPPVMPVTDQRGDNVQKTKWVARDNAPFRWRMAISGSVR